MARHAVAVVPDLLQRRLRLFTLAQMRELEAGLGIGRSRRFRKDILAAGALYRMYLTVRDTKARMPRLLALDTLIKALGEAEGALGEARGALDHLDLWSRSDLHDELRNMLGDDLSAANAIASVQIAAARVRDNLPGAAGGRPNHAVLRQLCGQLVAIYERLTGKPFTSYAHRSAKARSRSSCPTVRSGLPRPRKWSTHG